MKFRDEAYSFDDVLLEPGFSELESRMDVDLSTSLTMYGDSKLDNLQFPVVSANMDTVTEEKMAIAMGQYGGAGVLHRFREHADVTKWLEQCRDSDVPKIPSFGINDIATTRQFIEFGLENSLINAVCIDVAHGDHFRVVRAIEHLSRAFEHLDIIAGNVATAEGAARLVHAGASVIKVGIGPGSVCTTRVVTGHGVPQLTAIINVAEAVKHHARVIADGGLRYPGDVMKALAAGADAVMVGSLLAGSEEAPGELIAEHSRGPFYKAFRGSASRDSQRNRKAGGGRVEGVSAKVPYRGPVYRTLDNIKAGLRSGFSYTGARNMIELHEKATFIPISNNTLRENHPHHPYRL